MSKTRSRAPRVLKFGGTSVGSAPAVRNALAITEGSGAGTIVVVSAMNGITDLLLAAGNAAVRGDRTTAHSCAEEFLNRHLTLIHELFPVASAELGLGERTADMTRELDATCDSVAVLRELTPRTLDLVASYGERLLAEIFAAALRERGVKATLVDAVELIETERRPDGVWPLFDRTAANVAARLVPLLAKGVAVVPGFIGRGPDGEIVTLGRGGTDFSAAILARCSGASSVTLYKEVDGLMTADPRAVPDARVLDQLHYREAAELAYYGAKILHPRTMVPLVDQGIPLYIRNTFNPGFEGTRIAKDIPPSEYPVKALTAIEGQAILSVEGGGMIGVPGVAARTFTALAEAGHSVTMISQASSESSICLVVPEREAQHAARALERAFAHEIRERFIDRIGVERDVALVAVVGLGMKGTPGIAARTFSAIARERINILAIAQGSSELNITIGIRKSDVPRALRALHAEYQLDRIRPLPDLAEHRTSITLLGFGQIGRALATQLVEQDRYFRYDLGVELPCIAVADRSGVRIQEKGLTLRRLRALADSKSKGEPVVPGGKDRRDALADEIRQRVFRLPSGRSILVDVTADETAPLLRDALLAGMHVVLANKKPLAIPQAEYDALFATARAKDVSIRYEATVGAGLPILDTLAKLRDAGDPVVSILGCLSGTLGYLMTRIQEGVPFSLAVRQAYELGYTEPDPRDDLSGMDVARKALILARSLGRRLDLADLKLEPLFPEELSNPDPARFIAGLEAVDGVIQRRMEIAAKKGEVLRYVARIGARRVSVGIEAVPADSPLGRLHGTDNQIVLRTKRYDMNPLVVTGPGAGSEVTAAGVLNDIVAIATGGSRRLRNGRRT
jgi:bifunctional aspartokinase / homoserine dehydrogenase 1